MNVTEIARSLNRDAVSAAPCAWLPAISIFVDEHYENFDYDIIGPRDRLRIARVLEAAGFRQLSGRVFEGPEGRLEFPRPTRSLAGDPAAEMESILARPQRTALATPTQVLLATMRREGGRLDATREGELVDLVRVQPANLDKVGDWLRGSAAESAFRRLAPELAAAQEEGFQQRRRGRFRSRLPR